MPMALWTPATSSFPGMNEIAASPGAPPGIMGGMQNRMTESCFLSKYGRRLWTIEGWKCFMLFIFLAAAGSAKMVVMRELGSNWRNVASLQ